MAADRALAVWRCRRRLGEKVARLLRNKAFVNNLFIKIEKMHTKIIQNRKKILILAAPLLLVVGCAGLGPANQPPEQIVRDLAAKRWQAIIAKDYARAYQLSAPGYRKVKSAEQFRAAYESAPVKRVSAEVVSLSCDAEKCRVTVELKNTPVLPFPFRGTVASAIDETWLKEDGSWWAVEPL